MCYQKFTTCVKFCEFFIKNSQKFTRNSTKRKETKMQENLNYVRQRLVDSGSKDFKDDEYFPRFINIETTNNCTARCVMCGIEEWRKKIKSPYMQDELFYKITDEIKAHKDYVTKIAMFVGNECLLDKNLPARISYLKRGGGD